MTAGLPSGERPAGPEFIQAQDWVRHILTHPAWPPGEDFLYSDGSSHLLAAILQEATGTTALDYARSRLFEPLGIETRPALVRLLTESVTPAQALARYDKADFSWPVDPQGVHTGWWGLRLRPRDMVKVGQLYLVDGRGDGQQLGPAEWIDQATTQHVTAGPNGDGYGYQWWTDTVDGDETFRAVGFGGELIEVIPDRDLVVVTATELHQADPADYGINPTTMITFVDDTIVTRVSHD